MALLLNRRDVEGLLTVEDAIEVVQEAFREHALGRVIMPQRVVIKVEAHGGTYHGMPAYVAGGTEALSVKIVAAFPRNPTAHGLPTTIGLLVLGDPRTGAPLAVMDASYLTAVRTGAASGVAARFLARKDTHAVGLFGGGVQAETQLAAMCAVRPIEKATLYDIDPARARAFAEKASRRLRIEVAVAREPRAAVASQDLVVVATSSVTPVFDGSWLEPGQHVTAIGSHTPRDRELDTTAVARSKVFADHVDACLAEAGDVIIPIQEGAITTSHVRAGLGDLVAGLKPGRERDDEITLFKSVGVALEDAATARFVYDRARAAGVGTEFQF